jgi:hypothetical protein
VGAFLAWHFLKGRKRIAVIAVVALASIAMVITLRVSTRQMLVIVDENDLGIRDLALILPEGYSLEAKNIPPHSEYSLSFHSMTQSSIIVLVKGHFTNGAEIQQTQLSVTSTKPESWHAKRRIVVQSDGLLRLLGD